MVEEIMDPIRLGVIGCGYWGPNLIRNFVNLPGSEVVIVADVNEKRLQYVRERYPSIETTEDYHTLFLMGLDAAVVATQPAQHFSIARECLHHGLSVLVEKPMALSSRDAEQLIELANERDLHLMSGHTLVYNSAVRALKDLIQSGELGEVFYIDSLRASLGPFRHDLDVLWDLAPHDISVLLYLLGHDPISVSASGGSHIHEGICDVANLSLLFPGEITANVQVSWLEPCKLRRVKVVGSHKMATFDDVAPVEKIKIYDARVDIQAHADTVIEFPLSYRLGDVVSPQIDSTEPLRRECEDFIRSIATGAEPECDGEFGLRVIRVLEAADRSLRNGNDHELIIAADRLVEEAIPL